MTHADLLEIQRATVARIKARSDYRPFRASPRTQRHVYSDAQIEARRRGGRNAAAVRIARMVTTRSRVAARYAWLTGSSLTQSAHALGIGLATVARAWRQLYPGVDAWQRYRVAVGGGRVA